MIFVCFYGCVAFPLKPGLYKLNGGSGRCPCRRHPCQLTHQAVRRTHYTSVRTHKNQSFSSHRPSNGEKKYVFRNLRDAIYNFCYGLKKNFLITSRRIAAVSLYNLFTPVALFREIGSDLSIV